LQGAPRGGHVDAAGKKTAQAAHFEVQREVDRILQVLFQSRRKEGRFDLESAETAMRVSMHRAASAALTQLLQFAPPDSQRSLPCSCGHQARYKEQRSKSVLTIVGLVTLMRPYYLCSRCHVGQFPADSELDIVNTEFSPGVRRMQALVGQQSSFDQGRQELQMLAGIEVTTKAVERTAEEIGADIARCDQKEIDRAVQLQLPLEIGPKVPILYILMDGTGIPVRKSETEGRQGKTEGQPARTREVKLGCVFTQTGLDEEGYPIRDLASTTYVGAIETAEEFGKRMYVEAWKRGWSDADKKVVIGDGAEWIRNITDQHFPGTVQIVDIFHARQHLWDIARALHPLDQPAQQRWILRHQPKLDSGQIEKLTSYLDSRRVDATPAQHEILRVEIAFFDKNKDRMRYTEFRAQGLFIGSGVIEAGCKTLIGARLKQSGMFWSVEGANAIIALRCCHMNNRFEDYWDQRRAA